VNLFFTASGCCCLCETKGGDDVMATKVQASMKQLDVVKRKTRIFVCRIMDI